MNRHEIEALYRAHGAMVLRRARAILGDEQAAKDAMQEVFICALRAGDQFRGEASPTTWLYRMTTNHCLNVIRDGGRRAELLRTHAPAGEPTGSSPEQALAVARMLRQLPEELREIAVYYYVDQMNQDEIAEMIGVSRRTIGNRVEEFRTRARAALEVA